MYRTTWAHSTSAAGSQRWQETCARLLTPLTLWICVSASIRYGYYGDHRMELGPSSSRLIKASSVFVQQVEVRDVDKKGVSLYAFSEEPKLSHHANWSVSNYLVIGAYSRKGFSFWLNKGSRISTRLEAHPTHVNQLQVVMLKGERTFEILQPEQSSYMSGFNESKVGKYAVYSIEEDDRYYLDIINSNRRSIIITLNANVSSKMYDVTKAKAICSTEKGCSCQLSLVFPNTHYVILTTPVDGNLGEWNIELSFVARVITYIGILGFIVVMILLILKYLGACDSATSNVVEDSREEINETYPIVPRKTVPQTYGTNEEDDDSGASSSSSEELYDEKLCVICYDEQRNCFFVPCGHCATCYDCAQRIMDGESKACPICRRLIHKKETLHSEFSLYIKFGSRPVVIVSSPSSAEECFTRNDIAFANRPGLLAGKHLGYNYTTLAWASYGPHWRNFLRIASLEILSSHRLQMFHCIRTDEVRSFISRLVRGSSGGKFQVVDMKSSFFELTLNVIMRMIAGKRYSGEDTRQPNPTKLIGLNRS